MKTTKKLRLGPLPKLESTRLTFVCSGSLKVNLDRYAALHAQTYGEQVDVVALTRTCSTLSWKVIEGSKGRASSAPFETRGPRGVSPAQLNLR